MASSLSNLSALRSFHQCAQALHPSGLHQPLSGNLRKYAFLVDKYRHKHLASSPLYLRTPWLGDTTTRVTSYDEEATLAVGPVGEKQKLLDYSSRYPRQPEVSVTEGIPEAPALPSWDPLRTKNWATWRARLFTSEDFIHLHAASTFFFLFSFLVIEGIDVATIITTGDLWAPPSWLVTCPIALSAVIGSVTGIQLAQQFRPPGAVRTVFINTAIGNLISLWCNLGATEVYPDALRDPLTERVIGTILLAAVIGSIIQYITDFEDLLKSRRLSKRSTYGIVAYISPLVIPAIFLALACKAALVGSSEWASAYRALHPGYYEFLFHNGIIGLAAGSIAAFAVTLRDKQLIFPYAEVVLIYFALLSYIIFIFWCWNRYADWLPEFIMNAAFPFDPLPAVS